MPTITVQQALEMAIQQYQCGILPVAENLCRQILAAQPKHPDTLHLLGVIASDTGQIPTALELLNEAIATAPAVPAYYNSLGLALAAQGDWDAAIAAYRDALEMNPEYAEAYHNLANSYASKRQLDDAIEAYQATLRLMPNHHRAQNNLGSALLAQGNLSSALAAFQQAIQLKPDFTEAHFNLGNTYRDNKQLEPAATAFREAIRLRRDFAEAYVNLGAIKGDQGRMDEALECLRHAHALRPNDARIHSNVISALLYLPDLDPETIAREHFRWAQQHANPLKSLWSPPTNVCNLDRRLRVGYISRDFCDHPVGRFFLPLLEHHNHEAFETYCYSDTTSIDHVTERIRASVNIWRNIVNSPDRSVADLIRSDQIDLLVDLAGHTACNRLLVFALKPAPVQITWLGYPSTTGLDAMDYRLTDALADPPGPMEACYSEQLIRMPETAWCYEPHDQSLIQGLPALRGEGITFASLNNYSKLNPRLLNVWARILKAIPDSRLLLRTEKGSHSKRTADVFHQNGIASHRLEFFHWQPRHQHFQRYNQIDIALDTFPYHGTGTTCDTLWMGVPVVTLAGLAHVTRVGVSLLTQVGLHELAAKSEDEYVQIAVGLAKDLPRLGQIRKTLRQRMQASPLMDRVGFSRNVESAYRWMWKKWCDSMSDAEQS